MGKSHKVIVESLRGVIALASMGLGWAVMTGTRKDWSVVGISQRPTCIALGIMEAILGFLMLSALEVLGLALGLALRGFLLVKLLHQPAPRPSPVMSLLFVVLVAVQAFCISVVVRDKVRKRSRPRMEQRQSVWGNQRVHSSVLGLPTGNSNDVSRLSVRSSLE
mmetsp:Transcript_1206/g.2533  ORF Transcript_1206/g.2533 Transcript_1206/m.2533 type:complete len:164 (-) Transcript_1206:695-1186(-)